MFKNGVADNYRVAQAASSVMGACSYLGREIFPISVWRADGRVGRMHHYLMEASRIVRAFCGAYTAVSVQAVLTAYYMS